MSKDIAIQVDHVSKTFHEAASAKSFKEAFVNAGKKIIGKQEDTFRKGDFTALKDISFEVKKGEFFGIVGRNGSGKSTLLKILAGVYTPSTGNVITHGKLTPFIELGVGFNPDLSGRDNVFLNGALLGFTRKQMEAMYDDIVEFAELEQFMDTKLKHYSSGMQVRLAFSVAIRADSEILLIDEVLAVGDEAFQQKCFDYFGNLKINKKTVILVTHDMTAIERFCNRGIMIENGLVMAVGDKNKIADAYRELFFKHQPEDEISAKKNSEQKGVLQPYIRLKGVDVIQGGLKVTTVRALEAFSISFSIESDKDLGRCVAGINLLNSQGILVLATGMGAVYDPPLQIKKGLNTITFLVEQNIYTQDTYSINIALALELDTTRQELILKIRNAKKFSLKGIKNRKHSLTHPSIKASVHFGL